MNEIDVLAFGAHPDDIELGCGGAIAKLVSEGKTVAAVDLTGGELGTRGSSEIRLGEAEDAARRLGLTARVNLGIEDGGVAVTKDNELKVIRMLRHFRPSIVLMHPPFERHPDHEAGHRLIRSAMFKSGLRRIETEFDGERQEPYRIRKMYCYMQAYDFQTKPDFYVDISGFFEAKLNAVQAYVSQVYVEGKSKVNGPATRLSRPEFLVELEARARYFGSLLGVEHAEAFLSVEPLLLNSLTSIM